MFDAVSLGAERIIAPMVETPYALASSWGRRDRLLQWRL